ncbi:MULTISPECIES: flagellar FlbD family protein [Clostridioides]|uniref:flagellar FlbD family protein n=1 Tax=Clostridioides TaxID=1870884 RepID=UPI0006BBE07E|nr:flagellar FlbD family protein [Clostridioides difficile]MCC0627652.1 flagellar FlbD family protein [Clostridioides sp. ES-S-0171-01]MCC0633010.1 flagellar FlbD family protein [Clostridioides sp. ZZV15-6388]MCC0637077.1 flagellar FlbD family protein [Clostridioides sp. ES-S-0001-02]MCC0641094.1 flagellar FlbD family protein [Clostridioides sp. ES-S-0049-03]MCC0644136.1 flagellar FlbD family protein [Clostridioides sp. ZZV14-6150]MCC0649518.1 flagellar FlbD family protein [Clostridioides sp.
MIRVTDLNGRSYILNSDLIVRIDSVPESRILLTTGEKNLVKESVDEIVDKVIKYKRKINVGYIRSEK